MTGECGRDVKWINPEVSSAVTNSTEMRCADMNLTTQRRVCKVLSEDDGSHVLCGGENLNCNSPINLCPDDSLNKTCFPVSDSSSVQYMCLCHSARDHQM